MIIRKCNLCESHIDGNCGIGFDAENRRYDICDKCLDLIKLYSCPICKGSGKKRVVDHAATVAQATCGENRTQYKTVACDHQVWEK